jgi:hypothetical protein
LSQASGQVGGLLGMKGNGSKYFVQNIKITRQFNGRNFFVLVFVSADFLRLLVVGQELYGTIARPKSVFFELLYFGVLLVKCRRRFVEQVLKKLGFEFFSGLAESGFGAGLSAVKQVVEFCL